MIEITSSISIPEEELSYSASRSSGPGGQNVNKVSTKVTLWFDIESSPSLSQEDKDRIMSRLGNRVDKDGFLRVVAQETRSQSSNKEVALERFVELMRAAVRQAPIRKKTRVSQAAKLRRLEEKKRHSRLKHERSRRAPSED